MDENTVLIYQYSKSSSKWYDATSSIVWYKRYENKWGVKYAGKDKLFYISLLNLKVFDNPVEVEFVNLYINGVIVKGISKVLCFNKKLYKIFYKSGFTNVYKYKQIVIDKDVSKENELAKNVLSYYQEVINEIADPEEDLYLLKEYSLLNRVNNKSVLSLYLTKQLTDVKYVPKFPLISPFGINESQFKAMDMVFKNRVSVIEGPPGTGKTQTILNIIVNAIINGKTVAVVSNNNSAIDNVYEKLDKYGYGFLCAKLGNRDNIESFFENQDTHVVSFEEHDVNTYALGELGNKLPKFYKMLNDKNKFASDKRNLEIEYKHFLSDHDDINFNDILMKPESIRSNKILEEILKLSESKKKLGRIKRYFLRRRLKLPSSFKKVNYEDYTIYLRRFYFISRLYELNAYIEEIEETVTNKSLDEKIKTYTELSKYCLDNVLNKRYKNKEKEEYKIDNYKALFNAFISDYPVVLSSTYSLSKCTAREYLYDYVVIDESSQVNMASAILSLAVARNAIVVGDLKQLPQIDDNGFRDRNKFLLNKYQVPFEYSYYGNSIMSSLVSLYGDELKTTMLKEHYRCNPDIIEFCNKRFYRGELVLYKLKNKNDYSMKIIKTPPGNFARINPTGSGIYNQREIDEIINLIETEHLEDVGIITPYRYQAQQIEEQLGNDIEVNTIHKFQGREKKTIIFSSVVNSPNDFVEDENLINVAVSRAVDKFILITSDKMFNSNSGVLSDLIKYITYYNDTGVYKKGTIRSIYDLLYHDYAAILNKFRLKHKSNDYDSENLTKELIKKILLEDQYKLLTFTMHVPLRELFKFGKEELTYEEYHFYKNPKSHIDFVIYSRIDNTPILAIEVDGIRYHEQNEEQVYRDGLKNKILEKSPLKLLRLKTNESNEEARIKYALDESI